MRAVIAISLLCWALGAGADCSVSHPREAPEMPDGATATAAEMHRAELLAETYLWQAKAYLDCGYMNRRQYNQLVSQVELFSEQYQQEMIEYRSRANMNLVAEQ